MQGAGELKVDRHKDVSLTVVCASLCVGSSGPEHLVHPGDFFRHFSHGADVETQHCA
jgi:hypothetical protein